MRALIAGALLFCRTEAVSAAELRWTLPPDCERADAVEARIEELVGRPFATVTEANFEVNVSHAGEMWELTLLTHTTHGATSRRELNGKSCGEVADAAALAMAMAMRAAAPDPSAKDEPTPAANSSREPAAAPPVVPQRAEPERDPSSAEQAHSTARLGGVVEIAALIDTATLPELAVGVGIAGGVRWGWLRAELQGEAFAPQKAALPEGLSGEFGLLSGALLGCLGPDAKTVAPFGCGGLELGRISGEGRGVSEPELGTALWVAARLEAGAAVRLGSALRLAARLGVAVPLQRPEFVLAGEPVHRPAALSVRGALGVEFLW